MTTDPLAADTLAGAQTPGAEPPVWFSTGMGLAPAIRIGTALPAALMIWQNYTLPQPAAHLTLMPPPIVRQDVTPALQVATEIAEDLRPVGVTPEALAAWARSMIGGDTSDMLDI